MAFIGDPGLWRPEADEVHVSVTFTWDIEEGRRLARAWSSYYPIVKIGGPALDDPGGDFTPGKYSKKGITITSRGCPNHCPWCVVPKREGPLRLLSIIEPGNIIQDNNLLACPEDHVRRVFLMLRDQKRIRFAGGLDATLLREWHVEEFRKLTRRHQLRELWFAYDSAEAAHDLFITSQMIQDFSRRRKRCYVLVGFNGESINAALARLECAWDLGFLPFAQFYRGPGEQPRTREWARLLREWMRPAAMISNHKGWSEKDNA